MSTTEIAERRAPSPAANLIALANKMKTEIAAALPRHVTPERFLRVFRSALSTTPDLLTCEPMSVIGAMVMASQLGVEINTPLGHAYLVPYKNKRTGKKEAQLIVGYRGMIDLAMRSDRIQSISAHVVYDNDVFKMQLGSDPKLRHVPLEEGNRGGMRGAYASATFKGGGGQFIYLTKGDIETVKKSAMGASSSYSPWQTHPEAMWAKTAIRRLFKFLPVSIEIQRAAGVEDANEAGFSVDMMAAADIERPMIAGPTTLEDLADGADDAEFTEEVARQQAENDAR